MQQSTSLKSAASIKRQSTVRVSTFKEKDDELIAADLELFKKRVRNVFQSLDRNGDGLVLKEELTSALKLMKLPASPEHIKAMFELCDTNNDDVIHYEEFESYALERRKALANAFKSLDQNGDGLISQEDIHRELQRLDIHATDSQILKLMKRADLNNDGSVSLDEWQEFLLLCTAGSIDKVFDYWAHASAIDIGETVAVPDNFQSQADAFITLLSGAFAGVVSRTATAPMDRLKVLLQAGTERGTIIDGLRGIWNEGGWRGFYRGNGANIVKIMPESALRFFGYEFFKSHISKDPEQISVQERFVAGALAGCTGQVLIYPLEISKTRLALARSGEFSGIFDCIAKTVQSGGILNLYRGLGTSVLGVIPYAGVDLGMFYTLRSQWVSSHPNSSEGPSVLTLLAFGATSSTLGQLVAYPFQLVRTKLQAQGVQGLNGTSSAHIKYSGMTDCFKKTIHDQGIKGLYRGLGPNFLKALPSIAISYAIFEKSRESLAKMFDIKRAAT